MVCVWGVDVFGEAVWCVFPSGEYEDGCARCVRGCEVCAVDCMFMARRMHSWSYSGLAMFVPCHVCGALLPLDEKTMSSGYSEW